MAAVEAAEAAVVDAATRAALDAAAHAMGYDAEKSDPLYKFWPFYIAKPALSAAELSAGMATTAAYGIFYDNLSSCTFDLGCAFDNYHGLFTSYEATCGELDYYVMLGPQIAQVTRRFAWLCGGSSSGGGYMSGSGGEPGADLHQAFVNDCLQHAALENAAVLDQDLMVRLWLVLVDGLLRVRLQLADEGVEAGLVVGVIYLDGHTGVQVVASVDTGVRALA